jgi:hypothetical protein
LIKDNSEYKKETTKSYIGGLVDGKATVTVRVSKSNSYKLGYNFEPLIRLSKTKPYSIQVVDDWMAKNGIFGNLKETQSGYTIEMNRQRDIAHFISELYPYVQDKIEPFEIMMDDILPALESGEHLSDREGFLSVLEDIERMRSQTGGKGATKYTVEYFKDEWDMD